MDTSCEHYDECGLDYCMYGVECPEYKEKIQERVEITAEEAKKLFELIENAVVPETEKQERYCICGYGFLCERDEGDELQDILRKFKKFQQALPILQVRLIEPGDKGGIKVKGVEARYCPMCGGKLKEKK